MTRHKKIASRYAPGSPLDETARLIDKSMRRSGIPSADREPFLRWAVSTLWDSFREERMNRRIEKENEIKALGIHFPNGTVRKDYEVAFRLPMEGISNVRLEGIEDTGLTFALSPDGECVVSGRPTDVGDFTLRLKFSTVEGEPESVIPIPVAFNPNPRDLWQDIPTPEGTDYMKPDAVEEYVKVEAGADGIRKKDMVAASKRGRSHAHEGKPRDDHFCLCHCDKSDWYIMAVADGAGSARYSRKGSEVACERITSYCRDRLEDNLDFERAIRIWHTNPADREKRTAVTRQVIDIIYNAALKAHEAIRRESVKKDAENKTKGVNKEDVVRIKDYATTLMFVVCKKFDFGWFLATFWVGDGAMCIYDEENGTAKLLGSPDGGEFSGQTRFLTMPEIFRDPEVVAKRLRMAVVSDFTALFLMTDGVSDPMFDSDKSLGDFDKWKGFCNQLKEGFPEDDIPGVNLENHDEAAGGELLRWLDFWSPGNHDDRTIAILY